MICLFTCLSIRVCLRGSGLCCFWHLEWRFTGLFGQRVALRSGFPW